MNDKLIATRVSESNEVYRVQNNSHEDPSEHTYQVFLSGGDPVYCECPAFEFHEGECKHIQAVVDRLEARQNWRNWQVVQKERKEDEWKRAMEAAQERSEQKQAVIDSARSLIEEWDALAEAKETKEAMMSKEEWREMSSKGRSRLAAWL